MAEHHEESLMDKIADKIHYHSPLTSTPLNPQFTASLAVSNPYPQVSRQWKTAQIEQILLVFRSPYHVTVRSGDQEREGEWSYDVVVEISGVEYLGVLALIVFAVLTGSGLKTVDERKGERERNGKWSCKGSADIYRYWQCGRRRADRRGYGGGADFNF